MISHCITHMYTHEKPVATESKQAGQILWMTMRKPVVYKRQRASFFFFRWGLLVGASHSHPIVTQLSPNVTKCHQSATCNTSSTYKPRPDPKMTSTRQVDLSCRPLPSSAWSYRRTDDHIGAKVQRSIRAPPRHPRTDWEAPTACVCVRVSEEAD